MFHKTPLRIGLYALLLLLAGCSSEPVVTTYQIQFRPLFNGATLAQNKTYTDPAGTSYSVSAFNMFLSHIKFIKADNSTIEVKSLAYISIDSTSLMSITLPTSLAGSYIGMTCYIGMDSAQNATPPNLITDATDPRYNRTGMWWGSTNKYVHIQYEGLAGKTKPINNPVLYHIGLPAYYRSLSRNVNFTLATSTPTVYMNLDIQDIVYGHSYSMDVLTNPDTHTTDKPTVAESFITAITTAIQIH